MTEESIFNSINTDPEINIMEDLFDITDERGTEIRKSMTATLGGDNPTVAYTIKCIKTIAKDSTEELFIWTVYWHAIAGSQRSNPLEELMKMMQEESSEEDPSV